MSEILVAVDRPYPVLISAGARAGIPGFIPADCSRVAVIYAPAVKSVAQEVCKQLNLPTIEIELPDAEAAKTTAVLAHCWDQLGAAGFTRNDVVIAIGGGATTDLAGFVAASWLRGIGVIHVPTTLLGMVDAAVGGKTGINTAAGKNLVGAFHHPLAVVCDLETLNTLERAELLQGMAEVVKCGFIADPVILDLFDHADLSDLDPAGELVAELIHRAVAVKAAVVADDFTESKPGGLGREILNYGHTLGHAIEKYEQYRWRHGEAISVGMVFAAELAELAGLQSASLVARHREQLGRIGMPLTYPAAAWPELRAAMAVDKKSRGAHLRFIILTGLASPQVLKSPAEALLEAAFARVSS